LRREKIIIKRGINFRHHKNKRQYCEKENGNRQAHALLKKLLEPCSHKAPFKKIDLLLLGGFSVLLLQILTLGLEQPFFCIEQLK
jgi:hypothetical protein